MRRAAPLLLGSLLGSLLAAAAAFALGAAAPGCGSSGSGGADGVDASSPVFADDGSPESAVACKNLECQLPTCVDLPTGTTLLGMVTDPSGQRPIFNAVVYVPNEPVAAMTTGASCDRCDAPHSGAPIAITATDAAGHFELDNVPAGDNIPLVVQIGKWRRTMTLQGVQQCAQTTVNVSLPKNRTEGDIPKIAITTGAADPLQCLLKKIGIDDSEVGIAGSDARIHLYRGGGYDDSGTPRVASASLSSGPTLTDAETLWNDETALAKYDAVLLGCEGAANDDATHKSPAAKQALYDYAKAGGRVLATHYHHTFFSGSPDPAPKGVAQWSDRPGPAAGDPRVESVATSLVGTFDKVGAFQFWLTREKALNDAGALPLLDARHDVDGVNAGALAWLQAANPSFPSAPAVQHLTFIAPVGAAAAQACGRVAFTNVHLGTAAVDADAGPLPGDDPSQPYPASCTSTEMTGQQAALEFLLFDVLSCAQADEGKLVVPQ